MEGNAGRLVEPHRAEPPRALLPDARLGPRRRGRAPGGAAARLARPAGFEGRSSVRSWLYRIATNTCLDAMAAGRSACFRSTTGRPPTRTTGPGEPLVESVWIEPYPTRGSVSTRVRRPGGLRAARERRARFVAPSSTCRAPARGADPARGARVLGQGGGGGARDHGRVGEQRAAARPEAVDERLPARASRRPCAHSATTSCARSSTAT